MIKINEHGENINGTVTNVKERRSSKMHVIKPTKSGDNSPYVNPLTGESSIKSVKEEKPVSKNKGLNFGYVGRIIENEGSWSRPDGYILAETIDDINEFVKNSRAFERNKYEYSVLTGTKLCYLTELFFEKLKEEEKEAIWIADSMLKDYVLKDQHFDIELEY